MQLRMAGVWRATCIMSGVMGHRRILPIVLLAASGAFAQQPAPAPQDQTPHQWRNASDLPPDNQAPNGQAPNGQAPNNQAPNPPNGAQGDQNAPNPAPAPPNYSSFPSFPNAPQQGQLPNPNSPLPGAAGVPNRPQPNYQQPNYQRQPAYQPQPQGPVPAHLMIAPGTFVSVRMSQPLSSDKNQQGDTFFATLAEPLIVNGVVVAQRGETVSGRVTEAQKAGRVTGTSRLGVELTGITLVDGQQVSIQSQMVTRNGNTSVGRDAGAIAGTTALGAAIGAGADWGRGAAIGAGAGAAAGILGVLLTRGQPTILYPETPLTFRVSAPVEIATDHAPQAFHYAQNRDYGPSYAQRPAAPGYAGAPVAPVPYYGPAYYPNPYYWGPGLSVYVGPGFYGGYRYRGFWR